MLHKRWWAIFGLSWLIGAAWGQEARIFSPSDTPRVARAVFTPTRLQIDGQLLEPVWQEAPPQTDFVQVEPFQGDTATLSTVVRICYDDTYLYFGVFCQDPEGPRGVRVPDLRRDFKRNDHDFFGVVIDGFLDRRNAIVFEVNPYGSQRDLLAYDETFTDVDFDALWQVRTTRTDSGWVAEMAIPWYTLRYPTRTPGPVADPEEIVWGINFYRNARRLNELTAWSPFPRAFQPTRMEYAGRLVGQRPPPPSTNLRLQPYVLAVGTERREGAEAWQRTGQPRLGGEAKWAPNPNTVVDLTLNTDFAQADADRQVNNLSRFSVFFPERRPFFLENASVFSPGPAYDLVIKPFFSRRIGLSGLGANSQPVPLLGGLRVVNQTAKHAWGGMAIRQRAAAGQPAANFAIGRYSRNFGAQNRLGGLLTVRHDVPTDTAASALNVTGSLDGFYRLARPLSMSYLVSGSYTEGKPGNGLAANASFVYNTNWLSAYYTQAVVTANYQAAVGFVNRFDVIKTAPGFYLNYRPAWKPKFVRAFEPDVFLNWYHRASDGLLIERKLRIFPLYVSLQNGGTISAGAEHFLQILDRNFVPLGVQISPGRYAYTRWAADYVSDQSKKLAWRLFGETGRYYDGDLHLLRLTLQVAPLPNIFLLGEYERSDVRTLGDARASEVVHLITPQVRLALHARLQLIGLYQYNTVGLSHFWNVRLAWEFKPLSFVYVVFNQNQFDQTVRTENQPSLILRQEERQLIGKVTYLRQF